LLRNPLDKPPSTGRVRLGGFPRPPIIAMSKIVVCRSCSERPKSCRRVARKPPSELGGPMKARAQRRLFKAGLCFSQSRRADQVRIVQRSHAPQALAFTHHDLPRREFRAGLSIDEVPRHPIIQPSSERRRCYPKDTVRHSLAPADTILWRRTANAFQKALIRDS